MNEKEKPKSIRGLVLMNAQGICEVYEKRTFTSQEILEEVNRDRPKVNLHTVQTTISKDMIGNGFFEKANPGKVPTLWRLTEKGKTADPSNFVSYDTMVRRGLIVKKKIKDAPKKAVEQPIPKFDKEKTQEERFAFVDDVFAYIQQLKKNVELWQIKYEDLERKKNTEIKELREELKGRSNTISKLNERISLLQARVRNSHINTDLQDEVEKWKQAQMG